MAMFQAPQSSPAVLLIGHGTRRVTGVAEFRALADQLQQALPDRTCLAGFLELVNPKGKLQLQVKTDGLGYVEYLPALSGPIE